MTDLRQAATLALEALEELDGLDTETECVTIDVGDVIAAIRTALEQQAEPVAWVFAPNNELLWPREVEVTNPIEIDSYYPLYTTPPQRQWDKPSTSFNDWWNGDYDDSANPFEKDSAAYWSWAGWQAAQRQWVGLTDEDVNRESAQITSQMKLAFHAGMYVAQQILKEKNGLHKD